MDIRVKLGLRIKELRAQNAVSQNDLAYFAGMDRSYLASVENGKRNISIVNIEKLASALQMSVKELFDDVSFEDIIEIK